MPWRGPDYEGAFPSLGWGIVEWWKDYLRLPSGPSWGLPFEPTNEQIAYVVRLYRVDPHSGAFIYRRSAKREAKGKGKSPEAAALALAEFAGPVGFAGWDANGDPVGKAQPAPWVQVAACSEDQTGNTYSAVFEELRDSPALDELRIDLGRTRVQFTDRPGRIEAVTSAAGSREGQPVTFSVLDETHLWLPHNGGRRLAATIRRNVAKMNGRTVETTNAFVPGEKSVAEETHNAAQNHEKGLLYVATEAPWVEDLSDKRELKKALRVAYGDSKWVDLDRIVAEVQDPSTDPADARRFYLNQLVAGADAAIDPHHWRANAKSDRVIAIDEPIAVGFAGSINVNATALIGCTADHHLFDIEVWERPQNAPSDWRVPRVDVHQALLAAKDAYNIGRVFCDPSKWYSEIEEWVGLFGEDWQGNPIVAVLDTNQPRRMAPACDRFATAIAEDSLSHDGSDRLSAHIEAMVRKKVRVRDADDDGRTRFVFVRADTRQITAGIAAVLAHEAAFTLPPPKPTRRPRIVSLADALARGS